MRNWRKSNEQDWLFAALWPHGGKYRFAWLYCLFLFWTLQVIMVYFSQVTCHLHILPWFFLLIRTKKRITVHTVATSASREMQWSVKQTWNVSAGLHLHSQWDRWEPGAEALTLHINTISPNFLPLRSSEDSRGSWPGLESIWFVIFDDLDCFLPEKPDFLV